MVTYYYYKRVLVISNIVSSASCRNALKSNNFLKGWQISGMEGCDGTNVIAGHAGLPKCNCSIVHDFRVYIQHVGLLLNRGHYTWRS